MMMYYLEQPIKELELLIKTKYNNYGIVKLIQIQKENYL